MAHCNLTAQACRLLNYILQRSFFFFARMSCSEQSAFHSQASDRVWFFPNCSLKEKYTLADTDASGDESSSAATESDCMRGEEGAPPDAERDCTRGPKLRGLGAEVQLLSQSTLGLTCDAFSSLVKCSSQLFHCLKSIFYIFVFVLW